MRVLAKAEDSNGKHGCDRVIDPEGGPDVLVQLRPAASADHIAMAPNCVPEGEILGRISRDVFLEAARALGLR
jgi:hypothetical protein